MRFGVRRRNKLIQPLVLEAGSGTIALLPPGRFNPASSDQFNPAYSLPQTFAALVVNISLEDQSLRPGYESAREGGLCVSSAGMGGGGRQGDGSARAGHGMRGAAA